MSKETLEHLSSLMDGELTRDTGLFLTRRLCTDSELGKTWERYHLIRDCLRQPGAGTAVVALSARFRTALDAEGNADSGTVTRPWLKPLAGMAVAASVALMAVVAVGPGRDAATGTQPEAVQPFTASNAISSMPATQAASFDPSAQARDARLNSYLMRHNQVAGSASKGFVSFVPIIAVADSQAEQSEPEQTREQDGQDQPDAR